MFPRLLLKMWQMIMKKLPQSKINSFTGLFIRLFDLYNPLLNKYILIALLGLFESLGKRKKLLNHSFRLHPKNIIPSIPGTMH